MSTRRSDVVDSHNGRGSVPLRALAVGSVALVTLSYATVLYRVTDVVGRSEQFVLLVGLAVLAGVLCGRYLPTWAALALGTAVLVLGAVWYVRSVPEAHLLFEDVRRPTADALALLTGLSVLRIVNVGVWALAFVPTPTFLAWYFAVRQRYVLAALAGGVSLGLFVLTGDAGAPLTLLGVVGVVGLLGFGELDRRDGRLEHAEGLAVVLAAIVVVSLAVSVVPGGASRPLVPGGGTDRTVESNLVGADDRIGVLGSVSLSPTVRFTVESTEPSYWRIGSYDRYTGGEWYRSGDLDEYDGSLAEPPGETRTVRQTYRAETRLEVMPAAWRPVEVDGGIANRTRVTDDGDLRPIATIRQGDAYTVESEVPETSVDELRDAGTDYPDRIEDRYTQLPESTPDRLEAFTSRLTRNAETPYETARVVERWLETEKAYSLDVERPEGDVADAFVFEMDAGYCVYYATAMVAMLRTQGIPSRFVVGYTPGEQVSDDRWVVRGLDAHAWVEVYFPEEGWVRFDPTPSEPRQNARQERIANARAAGEPNVDTGESGVADGTNGTPTLSDPGIPAEETVATNDGTDPAANEPEAVGGDPGGDAGVGSSSSSNEPSGVITEGSTASASDGERGDGDAGWDGPDLPTPTRERVLLGAIVLGGVVAGVHRSGASKRAYRAVWLRRQPRRTPVADAERAFERLEYLLSNRHRERRPSETPRQYLRTVGDERARRVGVIYERAHYAGRLDRADADEAIELVDELVREESVFGRLGRFGRRGG